MAKKTTKSKPLTNPKWELFCRCYTSNRELFGNATHAYAEAFHYKLDELSRDDAEYETDEETGITKRVTPSSYDKALNVCAVMGNRLLRITKVNDRLNQLLNELCKEEIVDAELSWVIMQRTDLSPKVAAIKEFNAVQGRTKKKIELTGPNGQSLFDDETKTKSKTAVKDYLTRTNTGGRK